MVNFHYREFPREGPSVANVRMDCTFWSGVTAQLNFLPLSGTVIERAQVHAYDCVFFLNMPIANVILVCPNHHTAIHRIDAPFDLGDMAFDFGIIRERLKKDRHAISIVYGTTGLIKRNDFAAEVAATEVTASEG